MDIKNLRPQKHSRYDQGYINPRSCKKVFESQQGKPIIFRSSLERKFIGWCESNKSVKNWGSECIQVRYYNPRDGKYHTYNPDFMLEMTDGRKIVVEIKPYSQTQRPDSARIDGSWAWEQWEKNVLKWRAAIDYFSSLGIKFIIITEKFFA